MTRELAKELLPILEEWANGKHLKVRYKKSLGDWSALEMENPDFDRTDLEWVVGETSVPEIPDNRRSTE